MSPVRSALRPPCFPPGYTGSVGLVQLTADSSGNAEVVYEVLTQSPTVTETYSIPAYLATSAPFAAPGGIGVTVSFGPNNASTAATFPIPTFTQNAESIALAAISFPPVRDDHYDRAAQW